MSGPGDWLVTAPAEGRRLASLRQALRRWLARQSVPDELREDIVLAADEALSNAAEHAYPEGTAGAMTLEAAATPTDVTVTVADRGRWRPAREEPGHRGRGLRLVRALADEVRLDTRPDGTTVVARFHRR